MRYQDVNAATIDAWVEEGWRWGIPVGPDEVARARTGRWEIVLTPTKPVPRSWFPADLDGLRVLGLASGGGQQMPLLTAAGARCTVLDYSLRQLETEREVAQREGYQIEIVRADMSEPLPFEDESFDLIVHPVSNCYIEDVRPLWRECFRILAPGGRLMAGLDNGINYLVDSSEERIVNGLPFNPLVTPEHLAQLEAEDDGMQFSHTLEEQIAGQLEAGLTLRACYEDTNGEGRLHDLGIPTFWATLSERPRP